VRQEPARPTLNALRAARDARRVATDILLDRVTQLGTVRCVDCGKPVAVRTDAAHPARMYDGRVVCGPCLRARRLPRPDDWDVDPSSPEYVDPPIQLPSFLCGYEPEPWKGDRWERLCLGISVTLAAVARRRSLPALARNCRDWLRRLLSDGPDRR
jgi:hypothetical protein